MKSTYSISKPGGRAKTPWKRNLQMKLMGS